MITDPLTGLLGSMWGGGNYGIFKFDVYFSVHASVFFMLFSDSGIISKCDAVFRKYYILCSWRTVLYFADVIFDYSEFYGLCTYGTDKRVPAPEIHTVGSNVFGLWAFVFI